MGTVFINYRREEAAGEARALFNALVARLGEDSVFMDVDNIELGRDFREVLQERLASCDLLLALIGRDWVNVKSSSGRRRLEDPTDFVRLEIGAALKRNIPVTPVLVQGAQMPTAEQLPEDIRDFAYRNGFELSHNRWESDVQEMLKRLRLGQQRESRPVREAEATPRTAPPAQPANKKRFVVIGASVVAIAIAGGGLLYYGKTAEEKTKEVAQAEPARVVAPQAVENRPSAEKKRAEMESAPKAAEDRKPAANAEPAIGATGVKIEKTLCTDLGNARYRLHLWGWASGEIGSLVWAGPKFSPTTGVSEEAKISCLAWHAAAPEDGPIYARACKRAPGQPAKTPWSSQNTFQWRAAESPNAAFVAVRGPRPSSGPDSAITSDTATFNCAKS